jgi:dTDP-4-dehydrorhamnose 3,5-epimerase
MRTTPTTLPGVCILHPTIFPDERGFFTETWRRDRYQEAGLPGEFVQDNVSVSGRGVVRGLHYQKDPNAQGKLVTVVRGTIFDVAVDLRRDSPTFRQWFGVELSGDAPRQLWIPAGFAHGFQALTDGAVVTYKCTTAYSPADERSLRWNDPTVGIRWPLESGILSEKDAIAPLLNELEDADLF